MMGFALESVEKHCRKRRNTLIESIFLLSFLHDIFKNCPQLFATQSRPLKALRREPFENIVEKEENAGNQHFLLFPQCFLPFSNQISLFHLCCRLQMFSTLTGRKFCRLVKSSRVVKNCKELFPLYGLLVQLYFHAHEKSPTIWLLRCRSLNRG